MSDLDCFWHDDETIPDDCYRVCGECGHAFTATSLLAAHNRVIAEMETVSAAEQSGAPTWDPAGQWIGARFPTVPAVPEADPDQVHVCPLCAHDF